MVFREELINLLYPKRCPICHKALPFGNKLICQSCHEKLVYVVEPICKKCGKPISDADKEYCYDCDLHSKYYEEGRAVFIYEDHMKQSIYHFKYKNKREYGKFYAKEMMNCLGTTIRKWEVDALIPIPIHKSKQRVRGFNQADVLAKELGRLCGIPIRNNFLVRDRKTEAQKELTLNQRQINLKNAFKIVQNDVKLNSIILIDDIYTTGSTINEAARILKLAGISRVYYICISIGRGI